jgi:hypothetical protein
MTNEELDELQGMMAKNENTYMRALFGPKPPVPLQQGDWVRFNIVQVTEIVRSTAFTYYSGSHTWFAHPEQVRKV